MDKSGKTDWNIEDKARWWRDEVRSGRRSEEELAKWLAKNAASWSLEERTAFKFTYEKSRRKWDKWKKPLDLG